MACLCSKVRWSAHSHVLWLLGTASVPAVTTTDAPKTEVEGVETLLASVFALCASQVRHFRRQQSCSCHGHYLVVQAEKLQFGKTRSIISFVDGMCVVQAALYPVILALVGDGNANVGLMLEAVPQLQELLSGLQSKAERHEAAEV